MDIVSFLRQFKIGPFALFDMALAYAGMFLLAPVLTKLFDKMHLYIPLSAWLWLTIPISVFFHLAFHQNTPLMKMLFAPNTFLIVAVVLLGMTYMGLKDVRKLPESGHKKM